MNKFHTIQGQGRRDFITVVSGLPRSGTSMMMRMLEAGGLPVLIDNIRERDSDNPNGYYELEAVKHLKEDSGWLSGARGAVVKIIYLLLRELPAGYEYRVVFMRRDLREVLASQNVMMERRGTAPDSSAPPEEMIPLFEAHLRAIDDWLSRQERFSVLNVRYDDVMKDTLTIAGRLDEFLGGGMDLQAMASAVEPILYRQRAASLA
ncbi:MAG: hypothetical protein JZU52_21950 [Lamprocystis purpurea]|uniref:sulfotransferase family protein n=1 Tax=Lamprocystis purpurea TaxID=61598 RepID=UPI0003A6DFC8|nr:sulfotransferase [Lamprocystis purpurea]MBV5276183.1 hypothetical protein [Lamprocystis purpurea]